MARLPVALGVLVLLAVPAGAPFAAFGPAAQPAAAVDDGPGPLALAAAPAIPALPVALPPPPATVEPCRDALLVTVRLTTPLAVDWRTVELARVALVDEAAHVETDFVLEAEAGLPAGTVLDSVRQLLSEAPPEAAAPVREVVEAAQAVEADARLVADQVRYILVPWEETYLVSPDAPLPEATRVAGGLGTSLASRPDDGLPGLLAVPTEVCDGAPILDVLPIALERLRAVTALVPGWYTQLPPRLELAAPGLDA